MMGRLAPADGEAREAGGRRIVLAAWQAPAGSRTPPALPRPSWCATAPLEVHVPSVMTDAIMMGRRRLRCFDDEGFRG